MNNNEINHYGVPGMKWGVRKEVARFEKQTKKRHDRKLKRASIRRGGKIANQGGVKVNVTKNGKIKWTKQSKQDFIDYTNFVKRSHRNTRITQITAATALLGASIAKQAIDRSKR